MAAGLSVANSLGSVVIDDDYKCYHVHSYGTITNSGSLPSLLGNDLLYVRPTSAGATMYASTVAGSRIKVTTGNLSWVLLKADYDPGVLTGYGLIVYTSVGKVTFDSSKSTMEPCYTYRTAPSGAFDTTLTLPSKSLAARTRYINSNSVRVVGVVADQDNPYIGSFISTQVTWESDTLMKASANVVMSEYGAGPPVDADWFGTLYFSYVDI